MAHEKNDHFIFDMTDNGKSKTGKSPRVTAPSDVVRIHSAEELKAQLKHYNKPFIKHVVPTDSTFARLFYLTKVRPALRFYCVKFSVTVPKWLADDSYYLNLPDAEKMDLFGTLDLKVRDFQPLPRFSGGQVMGG